MIKKKDNLSLFILLFFVLFFFLGVRKSMTQRNQERDLLNAFEIVDGQFVDCGVGKAAEFGHYSFVVDDIAYTNYFKVDKFCFNPFTKTCTELKKHKFPVAYSPDNPKLNQMLLSKRDFGKFKTIRKERMNPIYEKYFDCK